MESVAKIRSGDRRSTTLYRIANQSTYIYRVLWMYNNYREYVLMYKKGLVAQGIAWLLKNRIFILTPFAYRARGDHFASRVFRKQ